MLSLLHVVSDSDYKINEKIRYLEACNHLGTFGSESSNEIENVEKKIKALLSIPGSVRTNGLLLLRAFLPQCSSQVFLENSESWTQLLLKVVQGKDKVSDKLLAINILCSLIPYLDSFPQLWKKFSGSLIPPLLEAILKLIPEDEWFRESVELLSICMCHFPGPCGPFKHRIEAFFIKHLDFWNGKTSEYIATCVAHLPACGGGGVQGINHSTAWSEQAKQILSCLNQLLDFIYEGIDISDDCPAIIFSSVELPPLPSADPIKGFFSAWHRYEILSLCLIKMLSTEFPVAVKVPTGNILSFACKVFSVNSTVMAKKASLDCAAIASVIPALHCITFNILEALIVSCRKLLMMHAGTVNKLFLQTLKWTKMDENYCGSSKPYSILRRVVYQTLQVWLQVLGGCSHIGPHSDPLVQQILMDITPESEIVQLLTKSTMSSHFDKQKTKMKKKGLAFLEHKQGDCTFRKVDLQSRQKTCVEALRVLKYVLYTSGSILKPDLHKQIHHVVIEQLLYLRQGRYISGSPYGSIECQKELYSVLLACILHPHPHWPSPLQPAISIFSSGQVDTNLQISTFCEEALSICNTIIHPKVAVLNYSVHHASPPRSVSPVSEAESVPEPTSQPRKVNINQSAAAHVVQAKEDPRPNAVQPEMAHFEALQHAKRPPKQEDIVMVSENESEHYSDEEQTEVSNRYDNKQDENKPTDFTPVQQLPDVESKPRVQPQPVIHKNNDQETRAVPMPKSVAIQNALAQKHFADSYPEECEVSEDEAELIEMEEEEGDYEDMEEAAEGDEEYEMEENEEEIENYAHDVEEEEEEEEDYEDIEKPKSETCDSNGIIVSSTTTITKLPDSITKRPMVVHEEFEIVESEENDNNEELEHSTSRPDSKLNESLEEPELCVVVDITESPEKVKELQTGGGPHSELNLVQENCQNEMELLPVIQSYTSTTEDEPEFPKENPPDTQDILPEPIPTQMSIVQELEECQYMVIEEVKPEIHDVLESVVSSVSLQEEEYQKPTTSVLEAVVDVNGCDTTFDDQQELPDKDSSKFQRTEHVVLFNDNTCVVKVTGSQQNDTVTESHVGLLQHADECVSTSEDRSNGNKHALGDDDDVCIEEEHVPKKQCREEDNNHTEEEPVNSMLKAFVPGECD